MGLCRGLEQVKAGMRVFIKPNIVFWTKTTAFSKLGVITTSRVVEDMVIVLKERRFGVLRTEIRLDPPRQGKNNRRISNVE